MNTEEDVFEDYFIPKGSIVIANLWLVIHPAGRLVYFTILTLTPAGPCYATKKTTPMVKPTTLPGF